MNNIDKVGNKISKNKIQKFGLNLNSKISKDIKTTLKKLSTKMK